MPKVQSWYQKLVSPTFLKYAVVGITTELIDLVTYLLLISVGMHYLLADNVNNIFVMGFNYLAHRRFTFNSEQKVHFEVGKYIINLLIIYTYSTVLLYIFVDIIGFSELVGKLIQIAMVPVINYLLLKRFVYRQ
jgi:putative flippase GtrA